MLVVDRLSALMLVLTSVSALAALVFSLARWHRAGVHFHPLFQFLLMGLNGAFLTGDLFNLFVFFEVMLAASYGLLLHGSGRARVKAGLHYIAVNLVASLLFLIGVSLIYGVTGTLNMADLAVRIPACRRRRPEAAARRRGHPRRRLPGQGRHVAAELLAADRLPAAAPPVAAHVRDHDQGRRLRRAAPVAAAVRRGQRRVGALRRGLAAVRRHGDHRLRRARRAGVAGSRAAGRLLSVLISSGTSWPPSAPGRRASRAARCIYLVGSTLAIGALFLLIELVERGREPGADVLAVTLRGLWRGRRRRSRANRRKSASRFRRRMAILGLCFIGCALLLAGLPPLSGFIAKFAMLTALFSPPGSGGDGRRPGAWPGRCSRS